MNDTGLTALSPGTLAYLNPGRSWGQSNAGVISDGAEAVLVDTQFTLSLTHELLDRVGAALPGAEISTVVNTHANGDHSWGNQLLPRATIVASAATAAGMTDEIPPPALAHMVTGTDPESATGAYMRRYFGSYDFSGITITPATTTFIGRLELAVSGRTVELIEVGPAHTDGDVIVHVPEDGVVFAGDILFIDDHPVMWTGPLRNCVAACETILATGATRIVPGHGPLTDPAGVRRVRDYLGHVDEHAAAGYAKGVPYWVAAMDIPMDHFAGWGHRERLVITVAAAYRELGDPAPEPRAAVLDRMTEAYRMNVDERR